MNRRTTTNNYKSFVSSRTKAKKELTKWVNSTFITMIWLIAFLFIYYLWTLNANATMWYNIRDFEREISQLKSQKDIMETKIANIKSLDNISKDKFSNTDMLEVKNYESLVISDDIQYVYNN